MKPLVIVGMGLAGACTAWHFWRRGVSFRIVDSGLPGSSIVAAGLIHPVTGKQCAVAPDFSIRHEEAEQFYRWVETHTSTKFWHPLEVWRLLTKDEAVKKRSKFVSGSAAPWVKNIGTDRRWPDDVAVLIRGGARLDVAHFLRASKEFFSHLGLYEQLEIVAPNSLETTILCEGAAGLIRGHPVPWRHRCARGEILTVHAPSWRQERMVTGRGWLVPVGDEHYKIGATYAWDALDAGPTQEGLMRLQEMATFLGGKDFAVVAHQAGIRPILRQSHPVAGRIGENLYVLNGLGSKGSLYAPWAAGKLVECLVDQKPLESTLCVEEYFAKLPTSS
jgi:glycine/D-amino acid oxidase-like deaminating enzyme